MHKSPDELTSALKAEARRLGFALAGATPAVTPPRIGQFQKWLADGFAGPMDYLAKSAGAREHPRHVLPEVRSLLMLAVDMRTAAPTAPAAGQGAVARYAWGADYHHTLRERLRALADFHRRLTPEAAVRGVVDTAPLLEREFAQLAGLGWIGKNTMLVNSRLGSWLVLAALLTSETLAYDPPAEASPCGTCRRCLDACPTGALVEAYRLDARKCLSYLTIESREAIPPEFREALGRRLFGCDACQEACPWNQVAGATADSPVDSAGVTQSGSVELAELFLLDEAEFRRRFRGTALARARRGGLLRNAAIALGNRPCASARAALEHGAADADPLVREACQWALRRYDIAIT